MDYGLKMAIHSHTHEFNTWSMSRSQTQVIRGRVLNTHKRRGIAARTLIRHSHPRLEQLHAAITAHYMPTDNYKLVKTFHAASHR